MQPWENEAAVARFWANVDKRGADECWPWIGSLHGRESARIMASSIRYQAPAFSWMLEHQQPFPEGKEACHSCDNPPCVNPAHIWPGTHQENMDDCIAKGRARKNPAAVAAARRAHPTCKNGHTRTEDSFIFWGRHGHRRCRICEDIRQAKKRREV